MYLSKPSSSASSRLWHVVLISGLLCGHAAMAQERSASSYQINLPPSAALNYTIEAKQSGLNLSGNATVQWKREAQQYSVHNETRAQLFGKILDARSAGKIDRYGLAPAEFTEKRLRKDASTTTFDDATIRFTQSAATYPIVGGEQDRTSVIWQLSAVARAMQKKFTPGSKWEFFVAGERDAEAWLFTVIKREKITTPKGEFNAVHIVRASPPDKQEQQLDIWLAPTLEWYPVRLRFTDANGDYIEQSLQSIAPVTP